MDKTSLEQSNQTENFTGDDKIVEMFVVTESVSQTKCSHSISRRSESVRYNKDSKVIGNTSICFQSNHM